MFWGGLGCFHGPLCDFAKIYLYFVSYLTDFRRTGRK